MDGLAAELPLGHTALTGSPEAIDAFVAPVLTAAFDPAVYAVTPSPPTEESIAQFAAVASAHVPPGGRAEFVVELDEVAVAALPRGGSVVRTGRTGPGDHRRRTVTDRRAGRPRDASDSG